MKNESIVFFGTEEFSATILKQLINAGCEIPVVVTKPDTKSGRGKKMLPPLVKTLALENKITVLQPNQLEAAVHDIATFNCNHAVLAAYGKIVPNSILDIFPGGIVNVHPSLLPKYRGPSPIESAVLNGDSETGVSIIKLVQAMDAGPIFDQTRISLGGSETRPELYENLAKLGSKILIEYLPDILGGELTPQPQDEDNVVYCSIIKKSDGEINWQKPAEQIEREIRAYQGWPGSRTQLFDQDVIILEAAVNEATLKPSETSPENQTLLVGTSEKSLEIKKLRPAGRSSMSATEFLRGLRLI